MDGRMDAWLVWEKEGRGENLPATFFADTGDEIHGRPTASVAEKIWLYSTKVGGE